MGFPFHLAQQITPPGGNAASSSAPAPAPVATAPAPAGQITPPASGAAPAETQKTGSTAPGSQTQPDSQPQAGAFETFMKSPLPLIAIVMIFLYFFILRGPRKEEKKRKEAMAALKKGDEVLLISGKFGTIVDIRDDYVVVKVDETNNVKEKYVKNAIQKVIPGSSEETKK